MAFPFPYIAVIAGWMTAELGRQPWVVYGLMLTADASSPTVHAGTALFTLLGFCGLYSCSASSSCSCRPGDRPMGRPGPPAPLRRARRSPPMNAIWYGIAVLTLTAYVVLDGFDLGAGGLHRHVARTDAERRQVLAAIGPYWDANEVWLIASGGVLFVGFPRVLSAGVSGFYFAIFLLLWCLILRGISIEFRGHVSDPVCGAAWDFFFWLPSPAPAFLFRPRSAISSGGCRCPRTAV